MAPNPAFTAQQYKQHWMCFFGAFSPCHRMCLFSVFIFLQDWMCLFNVNLFSLQSNPIESQFPARYFSCPNLNGHFCQLKSAYSQAFPFSDILNLRTAVIDSWSCYNDIAHNQYVNNGPPPLYVDYVKFPCFFQFITHVTWLSSTSFTRLADRSRFLQLLPGAFNALQFSPLEPACTPALPVLENFRVDPETRRFVTSGDHF